MLQFSRYPAPSFVDVSMLQAETVSVRLPSESFRLRPEEARALAAALLEIADEIGDPPKEDW